jgi:hypothetical protein
MRVSEVVEDVPCCAVHDIDTVRLHVVVAGAASGM